MNICLSHRVVTAMPFTSFFGLMIVFLGRVSGWCGLSLAQNCFFCILRCFFLNRKFINLLSNVVKVTSDILEILISCLKHSQHLLWHILNPHYTTTTVARWSLPIFRGNIWPTSLIPISIVVPIEVFFEIVVSIFDILTLSVVITIILSLISLTLEPIILIGTLVVWSETPYQIITIYALSSY